MSDDVRAEHRHRYTHRISEKRREGFPLLGHYDTWLIDALQILVEQNHNILIYPTNTNTADFGYTPERPCGTVPLQSTELTQAVNALTIDPKLTREQKYLSSQQGVKVCFLPVVYREEKSLFARLVLAMPKYLEDAGTMAHEWIQHVDGNRIFPKLEVYLRMYCEHYLRNKRIESAVIGMTEEVQRLRELNINTLPPVHQESQLQDNNVMLQDENGDANLMEQTATEIRHWPEPLMPPRLIAAPTVRILANPARATVDVTENPTKRKRGARSKDKQPRRPRCCTRCIKFNGIFANVCLGRAGRSKEGCEYFDDKGNLLK